MGKKSKTPVQKVAPPKPKTVPTVKKVNPVQQSKPAITNKTTSKPAMGIVGIAKTAGSLAIGASKAYLGLGSAKPPRKKHRFSISKATNKLLEAKIKGRIMKEKIKVVNSIR